VGNVVSVAGTVAVGPDGNIVAPGDAYEQTRAILATIGRALEEAGASVADVVRTRSFITDISQWEGFGRAHGEVFRDVRPASTLVEVSGLLGDGSVIEIELDAIIDEAG
jgi:enamine deaminase RidA (YjgF/YER057c/UK114 family)